MQILQGLLGMTVGMLILIYRPKVKDFVGDIGFAERYLGLGGTWTFILIIGVVIFLCSLLWATGSFQSFFSSKLVPFV